MDTEKGVGRDDRCICVYAPGPHTFFDSETTAGLKENWCEGVCDMNSFNMKRMKWGLETDKSADAELRIIIVYIFYIFFF